MTHEIKPKYIILKSSFNLVKKQEVKMVFCYQNCFDPMWEKIVLVIEKKIWNSRLKADNLQIFWDLFIQTVKGQNKFW